MDEGLQVVTEGCLKLASGTNKFTAMWPLLLVNYVESNVKSQVMNETEEK